MSTPEIIILVLIGLNVVASAILHKQERTGRHNVLTSIISNALLIALLHWAGLFHTAL